MGKKNKNKGFFKFNRGRFVKSVFAAVVLTVIATEMLWNGYYFSFMGDDYDDYGLPKEAKITSLNLLAYAVLGDESFLEEALSGPVAYDYISFRKVNHNGKTPIYETKYVERIPELEGAKADYNTRYQVLNYLFGSNKYIFSRLKTYLKVPEYNSISYSLVPFTEEELEQSYSDKHITNCRATEKLLENKVTDIKLRHVIKHYYFYDYIRFYGILSLNGKQYEYDMIVNFKSFAEFATLPLICAFLLNLSICLAIGYFTGLRKYRRYQTEMNNIRFKNGLIDALAHNLKTPMQIITVNAENIKDRPSAERKKKYIDTILSRSKVMNDMIDTINGAVERDPVESVFGVKDAVTEAADKLGVRLEISDDTNIKADRDYFIQAVYNLIDNAAQYGLKGTPIKVEIKTGKMIISNHTESTKFTPGTGLAIADRFLTRAGMLLTLELDDGLFKAVIEFGFY